MEVRTFVKRSGEILLNTLSIAVVGSISRVMKRLRVSTTDDLHSDHSLCDVDGDKCFSATSFEESKRSLVLLMAMNDLGLYVLENRKELSHFLKNSQEQFECLYLQR